MSAVHNGCLSDVDHERTSSFTGYDRTIGLKVEGGTRFVRRNSESSVEVIPERSVESSKLLSFEEAGKAISKNQPETSSNENTNQQLLQSTQNIQITTPPLTNQKPLATFNRKNDEKENESQWTDDDDKDRRLETGELLVITVNGSFELCSDALQVMKTWKHPLTYTANIGFPSEIVDITRREITLRHGRPPDYCDSHPLYLDTILKPTDSKITMKKMFTFLFQVLAPIIFWIPYDIISQYQSLLEVYLDVRQNYTEENTTCVKLMPDIYIVYILQEQEEEKQFEEDSFFKEMERLSYCHMYRVEIKQGHTSKIIEATTQYKQLYFQQLQATEYEIWAKCQPISIAEAFLNGPRFAELLEICVDEINTGGSSTVDRFLAKINSELSVLIAKFSEQYSVLLKETTDNVLPVHENILEREHKRLFENSLANLSKEALLTDQFSEKAKEDLQAKMQVIYQQCLDQNSKLSAEKCQLLVEHCFREIVTKLDAAIYDIESRDYQKDLSQAIEKYKSTPGKGPQADTMLISFMKTLASRRQQHKLGTTVTYGHISFSDEKPYPSRESMPMERSLLCESLERQKVGETSVRVYSEVFALEQTIAELKEELKKALAEIKRLKQITSEKSGQTKTRPDKEVGVNTDVGHVSLTSPVTSLSPQDAQWIHVEKQQQKNQKEAVCVCKEITEREVKLQNQVKRLKEKINELAEANGSWEKHCETTEDRLSKQVSGLLDELHEAKGVVRKLESEAETHKETKVQIENEAQKRVLEAEEQKTKAIGFASAQAEKVDELKRNLRKEKQHTAELEQRIQELQAQIAAMNVTMEESRSQTGVRKQEMNVTQMSPRLPEELINLSIENRPPPSRGEHQQNSYRSHVTSLWESIPPSLLVEPQQANPCCQRLQQQLSQSETEIRVLQQQVTIYKDDFEKERQDRENAHSEIASLQSSCLQLTQDIKVLQDRLTQKAREAEALKTARTQDQYQLQEKDDYIERLERSERTKNNRIAELQAQVDRLKRQHHVPQQPPPPYTEVPRPTANGPVNTPGDHSWEAMLMPPAWKQQLKKHYVTFANHMKPSEVINHMYARALLSYQEKVRLDAMDIDYKKVEYLYNNIVMKLTRPELLTFKQILTDNNQAALARLLPSENYTGPAWNCPRCTYTNPANLARCHMCQKRAPGVEPLGGIGAVEQCDADDAEWVEPARITSDTNTEEHRTMDSIDSSHEDPRLESG